MEKGAVAVLYNVPFACCECPELLNIKYCLTSFEECEADIRQINQILTFANINTEKQMAIHGDVSFDQKQFEKNLKCVQGVSVLFIKTVNLTPYAQVDAKNVLSGATKTVEDKTNSFAWGACNFTCTSVPGCGPQRRPAAEAV